MPIRITAFATEGKWHDIEVEDDVTAYAEYPNGATGTFITTTGDYPGTNRFEITGDMGKLVCEYDKLTFYKNKVNERDWNETTDKAYEGPGRDVIEIETDGKNEQHEGVMKAFAGAILRDEPMVARGEEGINGLMISNAMHLSSWLGKPVELPVDGELFYKLLQEKIKGSRYA
jgi:predicted dehydrogenase